MTTETTTTEGATAETKEEEQAWCRSVSVFGEETHFYVHRPTDKREDYCISVHGPGVMAQFRPSEALLRELHRVIGDALFGEVEERDGAESAEGGTT